MSTSQKVRASELASKNKADLLAQLTELRTELATLRVQKVVGGSSSKLTKMCVFA
jgi:large subunit ribosomal protein L35e